MDFIDIIIVYQLKRLVYHFVQVRVLKTLHKIDDSEQGEIRMTVIASP
jgi:hypothetical protein